MFVFFFFFSYHLSLYTSDVYRLMDRTSARLFTRQSSELSIARRRRLDALLLCDNGSQSGAKPVETISIFDMGVACRWVSYTYPAFVSRVREPGVTTTLCRQFLRIGEQQKVSRQRFFSFSLFSSFLFRRHFNLKMFHSFTFQGVPAHSSLCLR